MSPRGGPRDNQTGRPRRSGSKSKPIWCGQMNKADRKLIMKLPPNKRQVSLLAAARIKVGTDLTSLPSFDKLRTGSDGCAGMNLDRESDTGATTGEPNRWKTLCERNVMDNKIDVLVRIRKNDTGEIRIYKDDLDLDKDNLPNTFMWEEGNYACDCNRRLFFARVNGENDNWDSGCSNTEYSVNVMLGNECIYSEFENLPTRREPDASP